MIKKLPIILLILVSMFEFNANANSKIKTNSELRIPKIHVNLECNRPDKCRRFGGFCGMEPILENGREQLSYPRAEAYGLYENGILILEIMENEMSEQLYNEFNTNRVFTIETPFILTSEISKKLMAPETTVLQPGNYPIIRIENGFKIEVNSK